MTKTEPDVLIMTESCAGAELHWASKPTGESLQGWYKSKTQARKAAKLIPDAVLKLPEKEA